MSALLAITLLSWGLVLSLVLFATPSDAQSGKLAPAHKGSDAAAAVRKESGLAASVQKTNAQATQHVAGLVLEQKGNWEMYQGARVVQLKQGDAVPDGWSLRANPPASTSTISVVLVDGTTLSCPGGAACGGPLMLTKTKSAVETWLAKAIGLFSQDQWVVTQSRETDLEKLSLADAVLKHSDSGQLDVTPVCRKLQDGTYYLRIDPYKSPGAHLKQQIVVAKGKPVVLPAKSLPADFYTLTVSNEPGEQVPPARQAYILLAGAAGYDRQLAAYNKALKESASLEASVGTPRTQQLLRAYLASLNTKK